MTTTRIECPHCGTSYTSDRCGLVIPENRAKQVIATIACMVCKKQFDAAIEWGVVENAIERVVSAPGWFKRVVLRRKPKIEHIIERGHELVVRTSKR